MGIWQPDTPVIRIPWESAMAEERRLVVAVFDDETAAATAAKWLRKWAQTVPKAKDIRSGAMAILTADEDREISIRRIGGHAVGAGAGTGLVIGALAGALASPAGLLGGLTAGAVIGGIGGRLLHKGLGMHEGDLADLYDRLCSGRAALALVVPESRAEATTEQRIDLGGSTRVYTCSLEELEANRSARS